MSPELSNVPWVWGGVGKMTPSSEPLIWVISTNRCIVSKNEITKENCENVCYIEGKNFGTLKNYSYKIESQATN